MLVLSFCSIMYSEEYGKTINIVVFKQEQVGKVGEIFRERYPKVIDAGYQGIGFTCGGIIHQTSKNEIVIFLHEWLRRISALFIECGKNRIPASAMFPARFIVERLFG